MKHDSPKNSACNETHPTGKMQDNFANERTSLLFEWNHEKVYKKLSLAALAA